MIIPRSPLPAAALAALSLVASSVAAQPLAPGLTENLAFEHDGAVRTFDLFVPDADGPVPLVFDLHGTFSDGEQQRADSGFRVVAEAEGFAVAWPDSLGSEWASWAGFGADGVDDVAFLRALVAEARSRVAVDPARIYVTGFSNGGAMAQRLACEAADLFAAFVALAAATPSNQLTTAACRPAGPVPMLTVRGTTDQLIPFEGGTTPPSAPSQIPVRSFEAELQWWADLAGCAGSAPDTVESLGATTECRRFTDCDGGVQVGACSVQSNAQAGHLLYDNLDGVDVAAEAWSFLRRFTLPESFVDEFAIGDALDGNWTDPVASTQGLMLDYIAEAEALFVAWFTYTEQPVAPADPPEPGIGAAGQRWLVGTLAVSGTSASGDLVAPAGGAFEQPEQAGQVSPVVGSMTIEFAGCDRGEVSYEIDTAGLAGGFAIRPLAAVVAPDSFGCSPIAPLAD